MAKKTCKKCGTECCTCSGCNPKTFVNGLCPSCQKLEKKDADKSDINTVSRLHISKDVNREDRLFFILPVEEQVE